MLKSHEKFHSADGKRLVLVVDDEMINRELLGAAIESNYELLFAEDGLRAIELIREHSSTLSLILLDLQLPKLSGREVLHQLRESPDMPDIPVIVLTGDQEAEVECLSLGATDFIPKPYPQRDVILARIRRTIELYEDREIIQSTERDPLTGLYNRDYFYRYAEQYDKHHRDVEMDAIVVDVNHFHMINERFGVAYGDSVLRRIGGKMLEMVRDGDGIVCRRSADTFMIYCPHREDYREFLDNASEGLSGDESSNNRVWLRMGVYANVDKSINVQRRFDRAKNAADTVKGSFTKTIGFYDSALHDRELYAEELIEDFPKAIEENQFLVYYQPKFDVRPDTPLLTSAEALVRWKHPKLGMISPGVFIPLFEDNGLIQKLDTYVWREAARQMRDWKDRLGFSVPVSVNVSRIDMYDPHIVDTLQEILRDNGLSSNELILEVTESAYTQESDQIIEVAGALRDLGFLIEMDDFGTGYSSLNMLTELPIDALKLDMQFIRSAFRKDGNTHMLQVIVEISDYLSVPVIAEGVETEEQMDALRTLGCDIVQGYFFSKPVPPSEFEPFILQRKEAQKAGRTYKVRKDQKSEEEIRDHLIRTKGDMRDVVDAEPGRERNAGTAEGEPGAAGLSKRSGLPLRMANTVFLLVAFMAAVALFLTDIAVSRGYRRMEQASDRYIAAQVAAFDMEFGSDYLTDRVRCFVVTGEQKYLDEFFEELKVTQRRDRAVDSLEELLGGDSEALRSLNTALEVSNELVITENRAIRLQLAAQESDLSGIPEEIASIELSPEEKTLTSEELIERARLLVFDEEYMSRKAVIRENVDLCTQALIRSTSEELEHASAHMAVLVRVETVVTIVFLLVVLGIVVFINHQIRRPLTKMVEQMQKQQEVEPEGVEELRFAARTYNTVLRENDEARDRLSHEASHDALTGLLNRGAYDLLMESVDTKHIALIIVDVDKFKDVNDTYGHAVGDRVLKRVAGILQHSFRSVDIICRIGGDEFVVVMTRVSSSLRQLVENKIERANELLMHPKDDLPPVSLSVGVAFSDRPNPSADIFTDADAALYRVKKEGRRGCAFYGDEDAE